LNKINHIELEQNFWTTFQANNLDDLLTLAKSIGEVIPSRKNSNDLIDTLTIKSKNAANPKSLSALYGNKDFPFHTDGAYLTEPPKYVILRSPKQIRNCPTLICKPTFTTADKKNLTKNVWLVNGGRGKFYTSMIDENNNDYRIRFDLACMRPALADFKSSEDIMASAISSSNNQEINWNANQCIIFNNWKLLHSRADATNSAERILERVWIKN
jgi:alpha-ketoglutarate-dependent taurine dioxygenase